MHPPPPLSIPLLLLLLIALLLPTTATSATATAYPPQPPPNTKPIRAHSIAFNTPNNNEEDVLFSPSSPPLPAGGGGEDVPFLSTQVIISDYACPWGKTLLCCAGAIFPGPDEEWGDYIGDCRLCKFFCPPPPSPSSSFLPPPFFSFPLSFRRHSAQRK